MPADTQRVEAMPHGLGSGAERLLLDPTVTGEPEDMAQHVATYEGFVKGVFLAAAHVLVILALLAYFFG